MIFLHQSWWIASAIEKNDLPGIYVVTTSTLPASYTAEFKIDEDGRYYFKDDKIDRQNIECSGKYDFDGGTFYGVLMFSHGFHNPIRQKYI